MKNETGKRLVTQISLGRGGEILLRFNTTRFSTLGLITGLLLSLNLGCEPMRGAQPLHNKTSSEHPSDQPAPPEPEQDREHDSDADPAPDITNIPIYEGCSVPPASSGKVWYVDPEKGSQDGDGSADSPWRTLEEVFSNNLIQSRQPANYPYDGSGDLNVKNPGAPIRAGDTILLRSGHHGAVNDKSYYNPEFIQIKADVGHTPVLDQLELAGSAKWIIQGLTIRGNQTPLLGVISHGYAGPSSDILYIDNTLYSADDVSSWTPEDWKAKQAHTAIKATAPCSTIYRNTIKNVGFGVVMGGELSVAQDNLIDGFSGDGIRTLASYQTIRSNTIQNSYKIDANHDDGIQSWVPDGQSFLTDQVIEGNWIVESTDPNRPLQGPTNGSQPLQGIGFFDGFFENTVIRNNVIIIGSWHGISLYGARNAQIVNNTAVSMSRKAYTWIRINDHKDGRPSDGLIRNNLTNKVVASEMSDVAMDHNIEIATGSAQHFVLFDMQNQVFDLHLAKSSSAVNAGTRDLAPTWDHDGKKRDDKIDIGAYEY